jgi:hypothetical protein
MLDRGRLWTLNTDTGWKVQVLLLGLGAFLVALGGSLPTQSEGLASTVFYGLTGLMLLGLGGIFVAGSAKLLWMALRGRQEWTARVEAGGSRGRYDAQATVLLRGGQLESGSGTLHHTAPPDVLPGPVTPPALSAQLADWVAWAWALRAVDLFWDVRRTWKANGSGPQETTTSTELTILRLDAAPASSQLALLFSALQLGTEPMPLSGRAALVPPDMPTPPPGDTRERAHMRALLLRAPVADNPAVH